MTPRAGNAIALWFLIIATAIAVAFFVILLAEPVADPEGIFTPQTSGEPVPVEVEG